VQLGAPALDAILGPPKFAREVPLRSSDAGVATGLAWTPVRGDILFIEATRVVGTATDADRAAGRR
jgi:ATP-dependent Lon protease